MALAPKPSILFVCRDNAGLSLLAEAISNHTQPHLRAFSAGLMLQARVDLAAVECLHAEGVPADGLSCKPIEVFTLPGAPHIDAVVSLVQGARASVECSALRPSARHHHHWQMEDVSDLGDIHERRLAYRRLLPDLRAAIGVLGARTFAAAA
ncbi:hypothetical protein V5F77_21375 [Xanthobacter sp. DSM 24535]|uniref:arsenate reductase/protein-tyrosine-phosphatase family protein n=1 Tax=Roseixanthobacter psychrophilus TaxID=3119917 RepID=UPI0037289A47